MSNQSKSRRYGYRYSWRSSVVMIVLSALIYGAVVYQAARAIDEQGEHDGIR